MTATLKESLAVSYKHLKKGKMCILFTFCLGDVISYNLPYKNVSIWLKNYMPKDAHCSHPMRNHHEVHPRRLGETVMHIHIVKVKKNINRLQC